MPSTTRDLKVKILKDKFLTKKILQEHQNIHNNLSRVQKNLEFAYLILRFLKRIMKFIKAFLKITYSID